MAVKKGMSQWDIQSRITLAPLAPFNSHGALTKHLNATREPRVKQLLNGYVCTRSDKRKPRMVCFVFDAIALDLGIMVPIVGCLQGIV